MLMHEKACVIPILLHVVVSLPEATSCAKFTFHIKQLETNISPEVNNVHLFFFFFFFFFFLGGGGGGGSYPS